MGSQRLASYFRRYFGTYRIGALRKTLSPQQHRIAKIDHRLFCMDRGSYQRSLWHETNWPAMVKKYDHLFFDLDGTLWDLHRNTKETLTFLFDRFKTDGLCEIDFNIFFKRYFIHNERVWKLYREGKIEKEELRTVRFKRTFEDVKFQTTEKFIAQFANDFSTFCPQQPHLVLGTLEMLNAFHHKIPMHIITNGFKELQSVKMNAGGIAHFFQNVINSEDCGVRKPMRGIFEHATKLAKADPEKSLMIGDDFEADILGARDFGMDQAWLKSGNGKHKHKPTYTVNDMNELLQLLQ